ncbi:uncharacterized protein LOC105439357 [Strongylocentrotus purpuratus]|uniref:C-type lectin domain-containing protein n=1 Tax=Strongylocentrotus purpuratus TaxID=7668 RepID=A0A7M7NTH0_STRPU|nr:uncharacterized protein LOC105439357 [Strongylocentrotus purpuratus]
MSYSEASSSCAAISGQLVVFNSYDEMIDLGITYLEPQVAATGGYFIWVGCTDQAVQGTFECEDGTQVDSALWRTDTGQPTIGSGRNCINYLYNSHGLETSSCGDSYPTLALCEVDPIPDTTPSPPPQQAKYRNRSGFYSMAKDNNGSPMIDYCLSDHVMKTIYMKDKLHCAAECEKEPGCMSFNYRDGKCELNAETKDGASSTSFSQRDGCLYYEPL